MLFFIYFQIDDLMMDLYYMYRRSAKKWRELQDVAEAVDDHRVKPARSQGSRWIDHRRKGLKSLVTNLRTITLQFQEYGSDQRRDISGADAAKMRCEVISD